MFGARTKIQAASCVHLLGHCWRFSGMAEMAETQEFSFGRVSTTLAELNCIRLYCKLTVYKIVLYNT